MCLYHIEYCSAENTEELHDLLTKPGPLIVAAGLRRCKWYKSITNSTSSTNCISSRTLRLQLNDKVCPYVVVRHDPTFIPDEEVSVIEDAVLVPTPPQRGCAGCWDAIFRNGWVGAVPSDEEKRRYLKAENWRGQHEERILWPSEVGVKRKRTRLENEYSTDDDCLMFISPKNPGTNGQSMNVFDDEDAPNLSDLPVSSGDKDSGSSIGEVTIPPPPWVVSAKRRTRKRADQRSFSEAQRTDRLEKEQIKTAKYLSLQEYREKQDIFKDPGGLVETRKELGKTTAGPSEGNLMHDMITPRTQIPRRPILELRPQQTSGTDVPGNDNIVKFVETAFQKLHTAVQREQPTIQPGSEDDDILHAVRDGCFERAVAAFSRQKGESARMSPNPPAAIAELEMLRESVQRLHGEKAALRDQVAALLDEKVALLTQQMEAAEREARLLRETTGARDTEGEGGQIDRGEEKARQAEVKAEEGLDMAQAKEKEQERQVSPATLPQSQG